MTDRHAGYIVTLAADVREDDAEAILTALQMVKGVLSVKPVDASVELHIAEERVRIEFRRRVYDFASSLDSRDPVR